MLKVIGLSFAERLAALRVCEVNQTGDVATARHVRNLRRDLGLRAVNREVQKLTDEKRKAHEPFGWEEILDYSADEARGESSCDEATLGWLRDRLTTGHAELASPSAQLEACLDLYDAVMRALGAETSAEPKKGS